MTGPAGKTYGFGFIGLGGMGREHLRRLGRFPEVRVAAACDENADAVRAFGDAVSLPEGKRYTDYTALIADADVDAVVVVTPNHTHADIIRACLDAGKPFMAEKPFTRTFEEAQALLAYYRRHPVANMIGFSYRYDPQFRYLKELVASGRIGRVHSAFIQYLQGWGAAVCDTPMAWRFDASVTGTGTLGDLGSHMVDMARFLIGEFDEVSGRLATFVPERRDRATGRMVPVTVDDYASFHARLEGGVVASFQTSRNAVGSGNQHEVYLYGDEGTLFATSNDKGAVLWMHLDAKGERIKEPLAVPDGRAVDQWDEFLKVLRGAESSIVTTVEDGFRNQAVLEAIVVSHREGRHAKLAEWIGGEGPNDA
ncbi:Gfo/Idh/MocA family oxidoreductase [Paenibacillus sp.]|uniref:Gfo/Idh/MocA family protein n=1 Tax=Paenibacillus sp. TaxID=58172 RepID=UPI002D475C1A|nr:Gfo/Idh/MocA family oxidoreductase [Paenibacillus sp.]HZG58535.1 Gfo/Idh/MocA family oxidoreductase [Paenibacillus sp.]